MGCSDGDAWNDRLICDSEDRLGRGGSDEVKAHSFFRGVEFDSLRRIRAPFEPRLTSNIDTSNFPTDEIDQADTASRVLDQVAQLALGAGEAESAPTESLDTSLPFIGYTFKRFGANFL